MEWTGLLVALLFTLLGLGCLVLVVIGLPGTWIMIGLAVAVELLDRHYLDAADPETYGWWAIGACAALALVGEVLEAGAGAAGTRAGGGSRRGMVGAMIGGIVGAIVFTPLIPIPIVGTLIGALVMDDIAVMEGLFSVMLDFGSGVFDGQARWLAISPPSKAPPAAPASCWLRDPPVPAATASPARPPSAAPPAVLESACTASTRCTTPY